MVLNNPSEQKPSSGLRWFVALTPVAGAIVFPILVPIVMTRVSIGAGVGVALALSSLWFIAMLKTSEMPH